MRTKLIYILLLSICCHYASAQDYVYKNQNKIMGSLNPSFYGFGDSSKVGVIYGSEGFDDISKMDSKFGFINHYFEDKDFSLAADFTSTSIGSIGYVTSQANLHYIYKVQLRDDWIFNPSVSVGFGNNKIDYSSMVFGDQMGAILGSIAGSTIDPVGANDSVTYFDVGAGFSIHNSRNMMFGLNLKHLTQPETSFNSSASNKASIFASVQAGYEYDINVYGQNMLPEHSYLFFYNSVTKQGSQTRADLYQEAILGNVSFGINEHFNHYDAFSVSQIGTSLSIFVQQIEVGAHYSLDVGSQKINNASFNSFEFYIIFDFNRFKSDRRGDNSRFYAL